MDPLVIRAVASHGWGICCDIEPQSRMEKTLYAIDELTGLITAAAIMRPSKSVMDLEQKSVKKKYKAKSFAAGVNREVIEKGAERLGMTVDELIVGCIDGHARMCCGPSVWTAAPRNENRPPDGDIDGVAAFPRRDGSGACGAL